MADPLPVQFVKDLREQFGADSSRWPSELQDLFDPSIEAHPVAPPLSGKVDAVFDTNFSYAWAKDICGQNPNHERVEELRYVGWQFATTDDVKMCSESTVISRNKEKKSKDGKGFSDEIRSGDRRLMKLPMVLYRAKRKAENLQAVSMSFARPRNTEGGPMSTEELIPGIHTEQMSAAQIDEFRKKAVVSDPREDLRNVMDGGRESGNAVVVEQKTRR
jgi:hypothetical protein